MIPSDLRQSRNSVFVLAELSRAIACCRIAKRKGCGADSLPYLMVADATSAKFSKLHSEGKIVNSEFILDFMARLEEELSVTAL